MLAKGGTGSQTPSMSCQNLEGLSKCRCSFRVLDAIHGGDRRVADQHRGDPISLAHDPSSVLLFQNKFGQRGASSDIENFLKCHQHLKVVAARGHQRPPTKRRCCTFRNAACLPDRYHKLPVIVQTSFQVIATLSVRMNR